MSFAPSWMMPAMRRLDPETAHNLALEALSLGVGGSDGTADDPVLAVQAFGRVLKNPIGLAAGFDKNAAAVNGLMKLGFGFVETGTVTPLPQKGNPRPRLFRLTEDKAVINRKGFNKAGLEMYLGNLRQVDKRHVVLGANLGINKEGAEPERDYAVMAKAVELFADYIVINVSSPNTPGLRDLQSEERLGAILAGISSPRPVFVKIAPDLSEAGLEGVIGIALQHGVTGLIISNTTIARPETLKSGHKSEVGGLSGAPLFLPSTLMLARAYRLAGGKLTFIGVGGVSTPEHALAKILAGASLVQLYTGFAYEGPALLPKLKEGLAKLLHERGFSSVSQAVGAG